MPADPTHPWLPWSRIGGIRHKDLDIAVDADVYECRAGWQWASAVTPFVVARHDRHGNPITAPGVPVRSGVQPATSEADAKHQAERWILAEVRKVRGDDEHEVLLGS